MKKIITLLVLLYSISNFSQSGEKQVDNTVYAINGIDVKPEFPGGAEKLNALVNESYKKAGFSSGKKEMVYLIFVVEKDGSLGDLKMLKNASKINANGLIEILKSLPKWNPGKQNGTIVRTHFVLPLEIGN